MKNFLFLLMLFFSLHAKTQVIESKPDILRPIELTESDTIMGRSVSKEIGSSGGKMISDDGRIELIFPQGALVANTKISIQPIPNVTPDGSGKSYQLEPSGIQFKKPVELIFHYTDEEAETCPPLLMGLTTQDHNGEWSYIDYEDWDSVSKTLRGVIHHFSSVSNISKIRLIPKKRLVGVQESVQIEVKEIFEKFNTSIDAVFSPGRKVDWYVNGIKNGNTKVGFLTIRSTVQAVDKMKWVEARYTAPDYLIKKGNPVKISMELQILSGKYKGWIKPIACFITVYDAYRLTLVHVAQMAIAMDNEITDVAGLYVFVFPKTIQIAQITNYPPELTKAVKRSQCEIKIITAGAKGYLHIEETYKGYELSNDDPPEVLFHFLPTYEQILFYYQWICPKTNIISPPAPMMGDPFTPEINFIANGKKQTINFTVPNVGGYKLIAEPVRGYLD